MFNPFSLFRKRARGVSSLAASRTNQATDDDSNVSEPTQTYSKYFLRTKDLNTNETTTKFIPNLSDQDIVKLLQQIRSKLFLKLMLKYPDFQYNPVFKELPKNIYMWSEREEIMANVLLGPYIYDMYSSGIKYPSSKDVLEEYEPPEGYEATAPDITNQIEESGGYHIEYFSNKIAVADDAEKTWFAYTYETPSEQEIVDYLLKMRDENNPSKPTASATKWILYHNLLKPYLY